MVQVTVTQIALCGLTGMTGAGVMMLAYIRFKYPQEFVDTSLKMRRTEYHDESQRKWGIYGTGLAEMVPDVIVRNFFTIENAQERVEAHRRKRHAQLQETIAKFKPKE